ncbi:MAG: hypothetical protein ABIP33_12745 [Pseudolysinimonas sp.]
MSTTSSRRRPLSLPNMLLIGVLVASAIATGILGSIFATVLLVAMAAAGLFLALLARRPTASDWLRVSALEYADERDARLASASFATVGAVALAFAMVELIAAVIYFGVDRTSPVSLGLLVFLALQASVLNGVWGWAITRAVKRG